MKKRSRACEQCHRLKIKCDTSTFVDGACERCSRNNIECVPTAPRLQRDRIAELESEVQGLQNALQTQTSLALTSRPAASVQALLSFLDARIPLERQQYLLHLFVQHAGFAWPVVRPCLEFDRIRIESPVLLFTILAYTVTQQTQKAASNVHDDLIQMAMHVLGDEVIGKGHRSIQLVQALLVAAFWNKITRVSQQGSCYQLVQLASDMAIDLGIAGPSLQPSPPAYFSRHADPTSLEARRTWLACYIALVTSSMSMRRTNTLLWNAYHEECILHLEGFGDKSDILLCQLVRIMRLLQEISDKMGLCEAAVFLDGNEDRTHAILQTLKERVEMWASQVPPGLASSSILKIWRHLAMVHMYEVVLHTTTNKTSFAAPFIPGRLAVTDFPKPLSVIPALQFALQDLVQNCYAVIDIAVEMDPAYVLDLPSFCFAPNILYTVFVLVTTWVAATDPTNTYGHYFPERIFRIEQYSSKLRDLTMRLRTLDPTMSSMTTRLFDAAGWLEEWYNDYTSILRQYESSV